MTFIVTYYTCNRHLTFFNINPRKLKMGGFIQRLARRFHPNFVACDSWQRACPVAAGYNRKMCESCWGAENPQGRTETDRNVETPKMRGLKKPAFFFSSWMLWNGEYVSTSWILGSWSAAFIWPWWNFKPIRIRMVLRKNGDAVTRVENERSMFHQSCSLSFDWRLVSVELLETGCLETT